MAQTAFAKGKYELAEKLFRLALIEATEQSGELSAASGIACLHLADFLCQTGRAEKVHPLLKNAAMSLMQRNSDIDLQDELTVTSTYRSH